MLPMQHVRNLGIYWSIYFVVFTIHLIVRVIESRRLRWAGYLARIEEGRSPFRILTGKPTGKGSLVRPGRRWEENIRMYLKEIGVNTRNWLDLATDKH